MSKKPSWVVVLVALSALVGHVQAFAVSPKSLQPLRPVATPRLTPRTPAFGRASSALAYKPSPGTDGTGRGLVIQSLVLLICIWIFSIPPEFRRTHLCAVESCVENRAACYDCLTPKEWTDGIVDYYRNGGGIQFDFTIDPATKELWGAK